MKNGHILDFIDATALRDISAADMEIVREHVSECSGCRTAFDAAVISASLLEARLSESESAVPSPFFTGKVMNAIRSKADIRQPIAAFQRWWQASFSMVAAMLIAVFGVIGLAMFAPAPNNEAFTPANGMYTPETVIMDQVTTREFTNEQALQEIYSSKAEVKK